MLKQNLKCHILIITFVMIVCIYPYSFLNAKTQRVTSEYHDQGHSCSSFLPRVDVQKFARVTGKNYFSVIFRNNKNITKQSFNNEKFFSSLYANLSKKDKANVNIKNKIISISSRPIEKGFLSSKFGLRKDPIHGLRRMHRGIDIAAAYGSAVKPLGIGTVVFAGYKAGFGNMVEIKHGNTVVSRYAHLKQFLVDEGQRVNIDDKIGLVGSTGRSTGPHLHLEVLLNGIQVDPQIFLANHFGSPSNSYQLAKSKPKKKTTNKTKQHKVANNVPNKKFPKISDFPQISYQDYVKTVDGMFGFSAPE